MALLTNEKILNQLMISEQRRRKSEPELKCCGTPQRNYSSRVQFRLWKPPGPVERVFLFTGKGCDTSLVMKIHFCSLFFVLPFLFVCFVKALAHVLYAKTGLSLWAIIFFSRWCHLVNRNLLSTNKVIVYKSWTSEFKSVCRTEGFFFFFPPPALAIL